MFATSKSDLATLAPVQGCLIQRFDWQMNRTQPVTLSEPSLLIFRVER